MVKTVEGMEHRSGIWVVGKELVARERVRGMLGVAGYMVYSCGMTGPELLTMSSTKPAAVFCCSDGAQREELHGVLSVMKKNRSLKDVPVVVVCSGGVFPGCLRWVRRGLASDVFSLPLSVNFLRERLAVLEAKHCNTEGARERLHDTFEVIGDLSRRLHDSERELQCGRRGQQAAYMGIIHALVRALESKDRYTAFHSARVAKYAMKTARVLGFSSYRKKVIRRASLLHDIGKIGIDESFINKSGGLTGEQWRRLRLHPELGSLILKPLPGLRDEALLVKRHHERWDGKGYPARLQKKEMGVSAGVLAVCDAFDAMTSDRSYRRKMKVADALEEIVSLREKQFHPEAVDAFLQIF